MLREIFEKEVGKIYEVSLIKKKDTGETRGFGFVRFFTKEDTYKALDMADPPRFKDAVTGKVYVHKRVIIKLLISALIFTPNKKLPY